MVNENVAYAKEQPQTVRYQKQLETTGIPLWSPLIDHWLTAD